MGDVQISPFTIPVELLFFSWLEILNKTGLACSTQLPPLSGYDKIHFLGWCSKHNTKRMCTQSLAFWLHPYKNWKSVTVFLKPLSFNYLTFYFFPACFLGSHIPPSHHHQALSDSKEDQLCLAAIQYLRPGSWDIELFTARYQLLIGYEIEGLHTIFYCLVGKI